MSYIMSKKSQADLTKAIIAGLWIVAIICVLMSKFTSASGFVIAGTVVLYLARHIFKILK